MNNSFNPATEYDSLMKKTESEFGKLVNKLDIELNPGLDKLNPEVAVKVLEQMPEVNSTIRKSMSKAQAVNEKSLAANDSSVQSCYKVIDKNAEVYRQLLLNGNLLPDEKKFFAEELRSYAQMAYNKDNENKGFISQESLKTIALIGGGIILAAIGVGGAFKI